MVFVLKKRTFFRALLFLGTIYCICAIFPQKNSFFLTYTLIYFSLSNNFISIFSVDILDKKLAFWNSKNIHFRKIYSSLRVTKFVRRSNPETHLCHCERTKVLAKQSSNYMPYKTSGLPRRYRSSQWQCGEVDYRVAIAPRNESKDSF